MKKPSKTVTTIGVVAFVIAAAITGGLGDPGDCVVRVREPGRSCSSACSWACSCSATSSTAPRRTPPAAAGSPVPDVPTAASLREAAEEPADDPGEPRARLRAGLQDLLVAERLAAVARPRRS